MKRLRTTLAVLLFTTLPLIAQDTTKPFCFPHRTGDMWEYRFSEYGDPFSSFDTIQVFTISDSTDSSEIIYLTQYARQINPTKPPFVLPDTIKYLIDTTHYYVYGGRIVPLSTIAYKLNAQKGETWLDSSQRIVIKVKDKWEGAVFGLQIAHMQMEYYKYGKLDDTLSWLTMGIDIIADGFGLVYAGGVEATTQEIDLRGAVIDGILYGDTTLVSVRKDKNLLPFDIKLYQNYPNPFNPKTIISYQLSVKSKINLKVFNVLGQEVATLFEGVRSAGHYEARFDGTGLASGIYFYRLIANQQTLTYSMILLK